MKRVLQAIVSLGLIALPVVADDPSGVATSEVRARNVTIPVYLPREPQAVLTLKLGSLATEYERRGFFRIGALPKLVGTDVRLDLRQPRLAGAALEQTCRELGLGPKRARLEWRDFALHCGAEPGPRLTAGCVRMSRAGDWELRDHITARAGTNTVTFNQAVLHIGEAGRVVVKGKMQGSVAEIVLFDPARPESQATSSIRKPIKETP